MNKQQTVSTYPDAELVPRPDSAELQQAHRAIIQAGKAIEDMMGLPIEERQIITRAMRPSLDKTADVT